jgi:hypothetical protein
VRPALHPSSPVHIERAAKTWRIGVLFCGPAGLRPALLRFPLNLSDSEFALWPVCDWASGEHSDDGLQLLQTRAVTLQTHA